MRIAVIGLGVQGRKRLAVAGDRAAVTVDPIAPRADYKAIEDVPPGSFDAACVCVPDQEKLPLLRRLLSDKKHVLVEKPLLISLTEIQELSELSGASQAACYTAYNHRFEPHIARLKQVLD